MLQRAPIASSITQLRRVLLISIPNYRTISRQKTIQRPIHTATMVSEFKLNGITDLGSLRPGDKVEAELEGLPGTKVLLINTEGSIQALGSKCTHYGAPLVKGVLSGGRLTCPWHGACFNAKTGDVEDAPALDPIAKFTVAERDGVVYVSGEESVLKAGRRKPKFQCKAAAQTSTSTKGVVVVGGGSGAVGVVEGLRAKGYEGGITVISSEGYLPIDRPKLSKALIGDASKLALRDKAWYDSGSVEWVDDEVTSVDVTTKHVQTKAGKTVNYTKLVLATGGTPRRLPLEGFKTLGNIFTLRTVHDVQKINATISKKGTNVVIVGSSFIGMEVANALAADHNVSVIGMENAPLERVLGEQVGLGLQKGLEAKGVKFHMAASVDHADASPTNPSNVGAVLLKDGTRLEADVVILGVGVAPSTSYLKSNPSITLEKDGSLKTDTNFVVENVNDVYAIGDIATYPYHGPGGNGQHTRIEHWNVAQNAGRTAAAHIVGTRAEPFIPVFWSALSGQVRYCGNTVGGWDDVVVQGDAAAGKFSAYYCRGETVIAMAGMGVDPGMVQCVELMVKGKMPRKEELVGGLDILSVSLA